MHYFLQDFIQQKYLHIDFETSGKCGCKDCLHTKIHSKVYIDDDSTKSPITLSRLKSLSVSGVHINGSHFLMLVSLVCIVLALRLRPFLSFTPLTIVHEMCINKATLYNRGGL